MSDFFKTVGENRAKQISPVTLAFVGDAVYSLYVRQCVVIESDGKLSELQKLTSERVSAKGQSALLYTLEAAFTPDEEEIYHRGRNAKKTTRSKSASVTEYNRSTGFEAVLGYLYLSGKYDRLEELLGAVVAVKRDLKKDEN